MNDQRSTEADSDNPGRDHELGDPKKNWTAVEIIHCPLVYKVADFKLHFSYDRREPQPVNDRNTLDDFLRRIEERPFRLRDMRSMDLAPEGPLDICTRAPCYIVIELPADGNCRFRPEGPGIKTKKSRGGRYFDLNHRDVEDDDVDAANAKIKVKRRRIAYFSADLVKDGADDLFNLYVDFHEGKGRKAPVMIDPDIKNNGGVPPLLPPPPG